MKAAMDGNLVRLKGTPFSFLLFAAASVAYFFLKFGVQSVPVYYCEAT
jgi:hypothetical protein